MGIARFPRDVRGLGRPAAMLMLIVVVAILVGLARRVLPPVPAPTPGPAEVR